MPCTMTRCTLTCQEISEELQVTQPCAVVYICVNIHNTYMYMYVCYCVKSRGVYIHIDSVIYVCIYIYICIDIIYDLYSNIYICIYNAAICRYYTNSMRCTLKRARKSARNSNRKSPRWKHAFCPSPRWVSFVGLFCRSFLLVSFVCLFRRSLL